MHKQESENLLIPFPLFPDYKKDPYTRHNPCNTICCREDLKHKTPVPAGCYDSKVPIPKGIAPL